MKRGKRYVACGKRAASFLLITARAPCHGAVSSCPPSRAAHSFPGARSQMDADKLAVENKTEMIEKGRNLPLRSTVPFDTKTESKATRIIPGDLKPLPR